MQCVLLIIKTVFFAIIALISVWMMSAETSSLWARALFYFWLIVGALGVSQRVRDGFFSFCNDVMKLPCFWFLVVIPFFAALLFTPDWILSVWTSHAMSICTMSYKFCDWMTVFWESDSMVQSLTRLSLEKNADILMGVWGLVSVTFVATPLLRKETETEHSKKIFGWMGIFCTIMAFVVVLIKAICVP